MVLEATVNTPDPVTNTATLTNFSGDDSNSENNSASATITPVAADLAIAKTLADFVSDLDTNTITATFKLTVTNNGPLDATGVVVKDPLPTGATLVSADPADDYDATTGLWTIGALKVDSSAMLTIVLTIDAANNLTNIAEVSGDQPDQNPSNNSASVKVGIVDPGGGDFGPPGVPDGRGGTHRQGR